MESKRFSNIPVSYLRDQPYLFWWRETVTRMKVAYNDIITGFNFLNCQDYITVVVTVIVTILMPFTALYLRYIFLKLEDPNEEIETFLLYNAENIEIFTVFSQLLPKKG